MVGNLLFSSITFLYFFLPVTLLLYYVVPKRCKNLILLMASFFFYFWGEPKYCILMAAVILIGYSGGRWCRKKWSRILSVVVILLFLILFKYADFCLEIFFGVTGTKILPLQLALPMGISFYTFQVISYLVDVYRGDIKAEKNLIDFGAYVTMFPQLVAGPIVRFQTLAPELKSWRITMDKTAAGIRRFICGLAKKILFADVLGELVLQLDGVSEKNIWIYWIIAFSYLLQIYYDFSGYSDMAIGLGCMLGFTFPENFNYPLVAKSITEFWRRWHMTLGTWFRDYVYIPMGGNRTGTSRWICNVLTVWMLSGLWHGAAWNFALWGLYFGVILILEKFWRMATERWQKQPADFSGRAAAVKKRVMDVCRHMYTVILVAISFVIFRLEDGEQLKTYLGGMFGIGAGNSFDAVGCYQIQSYSVILLVAVFGVTPVARHLLEKIQQTKYGKMGTTVAEPFVILLLLVLCTAYLIQGSVHPFLYFRF